MATQSWSEKHSNLVNNVFNTGEINKASRAQLEEYLVILCNVEDSDFPNPKARNERYALVVSHLLNVRISEELHRVSERRSWCAIGISILAVVVSVAIF